MPDLYPAAPPEPIDPSVFGDDPFGYKLAERKREEGAIPDSALEALQQARDRKPEVPAPITAESVAQPVQQQTDEGIAVPPPITAANVPLQGLQQPPPPITTGNLPLQGQAPPPMGGMQQPLETPPNGQIPMGAFPATLGQSAPPPPLPPAQGTVPPGSFPATLGQPPAPVTPQQIPMTPTQGPPPPMRPQLPGTPPPGANWDAQSPAQAVQAALLARANQPPPPIWRQVLGGVAAMTPLRGFAPLIAQGPARLAANARLPYQLEAANLAGAQAKEQQVQQHQGAEDAEKAYKDQTTNIEKLHGELMASPDEPLDPGWVKVPVMNPTTKQTEIYRVPTKEVIDAQKLAAANAAKEGQYLKVTPELANSPAGKQLGLAPGTSLPATTINELIKANTEITKAPPVKAGDEPLGADRVSAINQAVTARYQVLHPGAQLPSHYILPPNATQKDFDRTDKLIEGEEKAFGTKQTADQTTELRRQTMAIVAANQAGKTDTTARAAAFKAYQPTLDSAERLNVMTSNYEDAIKSNDQQAMLSLLANHLGMTMGLQKGARLTKDIIAEAKDSRPWLQGMTSKFDKDGYLSGVTLTPQQMRQMVSLGRERFSQDAIKSQSEARYMGSNDDGPVRTPNQSTVNFYLAQAHGDRARAKQLLAADGWSVK